MNSELAQGSPEVILNGGQCTGPIQIRRHAIPPGGELQIQIILVALSDQAPQQGMTPPIERKSKPKKPLLVGNWTNQNPNTSGITRLFIHYMQSGDTAVHAWGSCGGGECDWGEAAALQASATLSVLWDQHFAVRRWLLSFDGQTRLLTLSEHSHYQDNSGRPDKDETSVFVRTRN